MTNDSSIAFFHRLQQVQSDARKTVPDSGIVLAEDTQKEAQKGGHRLEKVKGLHH